MSNSAVPKDVNVQASSDFPEMTPKIIHDAGEVPLVLYSDVRTPLASLSFLRRGLALAELAMVAFTYTTSTRDTSGTMRQCLSARLIRLLDL